MTNAVSNRASRAPNSVRQISEAERNVPARFVLFLVKLPELVLLFVCPLGFVWLPEAPSVRPSVRPLCSALLWQLQLCSLLKAAFVGGGEERGRPSVFSG